MPTQLLRKKVTLTGDEWRIKTRDRQASESDSNLLRRKLKLKPLKQGGAREPKPSKKKL